MKLTVKSAVCALAASVALVCSASAMAAEKSIVVLTAPEDHGWTGSVATFAKEKAAEVTAQGKYDVNVITCANGAYQITQIEDLLASGDDSLAGIVIQPIDDTVLTGIQQIVDAGIPYVAFDRIIEAVAPTAVSNVKGDNEGIGAGSAAYFVQNGLMPGDKIYVYEGDTSSVTIMRNSGFTEYLTGERSFEGQTIPEDKKWTQEQLDSAITYSGAMNWSRSDTKASYETLMGDASNAQIKWFYAQDDELAMGILEALRGGGIDDDTKAKIYEAKPYITGCGGLEEFYKVLRGEEYQEIAGKLGGVMSVTYNPSMIQTAIQDLVDHLDGREVVQDHVIECHNVTSENVSEFKSFN